jgi:hypothetical protein
MKKEIVIANFLLIQNNVVNGGSVISFQQQRLPPYLIVCSIPC